VVNILLSGVDCWNIYSRITQRTREAKKSEKEKAEIALEKDNKALLERLVRVQPTQEYKRTVLLEEYERLHKVHGQPEDQKASRRWRN